jgi:hypothetical protein
MASPDFLHTRLPRVLRRIIEQTREGALEWEVAAPPDAYAVSVGEMRFRIRSRDADTQEPYVLEFLGGPQVTIPPLQTVPGDQDPSDPLIREMYAVARQSALRGQPDPFASVEQALGLAPAPDASEASNDPAPT